MKLTMGLCAPIIAAFALGSFFCGGVKCEEIVVRPYSSPRIVAQRQLAFETRVAKRFGMKFNVEGRVIQVEPGTPDRSQQRRMYRFFDKATNAEPKEYLKSIELQIHSDRLRAKFEAELKRDPHQLFKLTVYETIFAFGEPGEDDLDVQDDLLATGTGWFVEPVLVLRGLRTVEADQKGQNFK